MSQISEYIEHKQLIGRVRGCGAKVKLIEDGDIALFSKLSSKFLSNQLRNSGQNSSMNLGQNSLINLA